jgi:hypothetical protein
MKENASWQCHYGFAEVGLMDMAWMWMYGVDRLKLADSSDECLELRNAGGN